ncbi:MAG: glutaredoxin domain-containing protein [Candidatus Bathyarchaeia archaeon]
MRSLVNILIYTTPTCPYCHAAKNFLRKLGVPFKEVDVSADPKAARDLIVKSGQMGVPVLDLDGEIIIGFDRDSIISALEKRGIITPEQSYKS